MTSVQRLGTMVNESSYALSIGTANIITILLSDKGSWITRQIINSEGV
ncbi:hypothetical protein [Mammaliicoccus sciuri]|nr:hypothetical protein [Mammaliicoccus sciuri]MCD8824882.1 hypothetical protein [Mammaliicoccus sciuri]